MKRDPARRALVDFLKEAKTSFREDAELDELEQIVSAVRNSHEYRRLHLLQLQDERLPGWLRDAWSASAQRMDRPALWPTEEFSLKLTTVIKTFVEFIVRRLRYRDEDPAVNLLIQRLGEWVPAQLRVGLETGDGQGNGGVWKTFVDFAEEIGYCPEWRIWQVIGAFEPQPYLSHDVSALPEQPRSSKLDHLEARKPVGSKLAFVDVVREVREALKESIGKEPLRDTVDRGQLRTAARGGDWMLVRSLAATQILDTNHILIEDSLSDAEA